ncbi:virion structural protein [Pseudomonas phage SL2]|uniref:Virion structural protein n=2 Tax=Phikzvirus TaxID=680115 RepID=A0AAE7S8K6_9CAUD|nr:virion structural protein [Pseudomonas phage SL2]ATN94596.1 virion structural protein [Pseudomonas phage SL2]QXN68366.1 virion structural protein [Pseudomonas phage PA7]
MRIELTDYNSDPSTTIKIYRHYYPFDVDNLPPVLVELPGDASSYTDETLILNTMVYYRISVVHNGNEVVGPLYTTMKRYYTGPQINKDRPDQILRGDNYIGRYGTLPLDTVLSLNVAKQLVPSCTVIDGIVPETIEVEKCSYHGNVLFISTVPVFHGSPEDLYNDGALLSHGDGSGILSSALYDSIATKVNQGKPITYNNYSFKFRLMTTSEYAELYVKLYPESQMGLACERVISNCNTHPFKSPVVNIGSQGETFKTVGLDGSSIDTNWTTKGPLYMVVELMNRGDMGWPNPEVSVTLADPTDRMMFCQSEIVNGRAHFFGGIYSKFNSYSSAINKHISVNLDGTDRQVHADMPVGVYNACTWVHGNKIYCLGGAKKIGSGEYTYSELYNDIQVWEDNGTQEGIWTTITNSLPFYYGASVTTYQDMKSDKKRLLYIGGYNDVVPSGKNNFATADLDTFDGTFTVYDRATFYSGGGGGPVTQYEDYFLWVGPETRTNNYTNATFSFTIPENVDDFIYTSGIKQQGTELPTTKGGKIHVWRDTIFMFSEASIDQKQGELYLYQFVPSESRWLKITVPIPGLSEDTRASISGAFHEGKLVLMLNQPWTNASYVSSFYSISLIDPIDAPIVPVTDVVVGNSRIFTTYAEVSI